MLVAQQPYNPAPAESFDFRADMDLSCNGFLWYAGYYARPQLFFRCTVCPTGSLQTLSKHKELALVFFSTFEPITLTPGAVTQRNGVPMPYDIASSSNLPSLYLCLARNFLGRVPLTPCFVRGTGLQPCPTALATARELWLTAAMELATASGFMRSTFGCGVMAGDSHAGLLSQRRSCNGRQPSLTLAGGLQTLCSVAGRSEGKFTTENRSLVTELPQIENLVLYSRLYTILYSTCFIECYITYDDAIYHVRSGAI